MSEQQLEDMITAMVKSLFIRQMDQKNWWHGIGRELLIL